MKLTKALIKDEHNLIDHLSYKRNRSLDQMLNTLDENKQRIFLFYFFEFMGR